MGQKIKDVMTTDVVACDASTPLTDAARLMRERDIGDVLVNDSRGQLRGIVTDRDIVVRGVADGVDVSRATLSDVCSANLASVTPDTGVDEAARMMRDMAVRRLPVVKDGKAVGIVSIGDLAIEREPKSALAGISAAPPNT
jgi:CBS domain-containing protein